MTNTKLHLVKQASALLLALFFVFSGCVGLISPTVEADAATGATVENYYKNLDDNCDGKEFRANLAELITNTHKTYTTYKGLSDVYKTTDADPDKPGNIILFYTGKSVPFSGSFSNGINREHVWPKNNGSAFPTETGPGADAHHLRPCDSSLNSTRGNHSFGEVPQTTANIAGKNGANFDSTNLCYQASTSDGTLFYPGEGYRGATARILMYMQVRWGNQYNLKFVDRAGDVKTIGKISDLMKWHLEEPPTEEEIRRNEAVYAIQGNRNPFIDHPEYAEKIFCYDGESYNAKLQSIVEQYGGNYETPEITSITLSPSTLSLSVGQSASLTASVQPANATKRLIWSSSNPTVATVDNGKVTALQSGTVTITASATDNPSIKATATVNVKAVSGITVSGTMTKTKYYAGEAFSPAGLVVTLRHTDGSVATANLSDCQWLDGTTGATTLSAGTTSVVCKYGSFTQTITGITVNKAVSKSVSVTRQSFSGGSSYGFHTWTSDGISGKAFMYPGTTTSIQMNVKASQYIFNTTPFTAGIISISIKTSTAKDWEILTSSTPYGEVSKYPTNGTSHGTKTSTPDGTTWTINTTDSYFTINYMSTGVVYIDEIIITYGTGEGTEQPPVEQHTFGQWQAEVPATCKAEGTLGHYFCSHCNGYFDADENPLASIVIPQKAHSFGEWETIKPATDDEAGEMQRECSVCHTVETVVIPALSQTSAFMKLVSGMTVEKGSQAEFDAIRQALVQYSAMSDADKQVEAAAYAKLQDLMASYNAIANSQNDIMNESLSLAGAPFGITAISLGAVLWMLVRKMMIGG